MAIYYKYICAEALKQHIFYLINTTLQLLNSCVQWMQILLNHDEEYVILVDIDADTNFNKTG